MTWGWALAGAILGFWISSIDQHLFGVLSGSAIGGLLAAFMRLRRRIEELESTPRPEPASGRVEIPLRQPPQPAREERQPAASGRPAGATESQAPPRTPPPMPRPPPAPANAPPSLAQTAFEFARQWLTTGNVPVKIGVIVSFFGVAFFLKYAVDRQLIRFPIELRLLSIAAVAIVLLVVGWRLRERKRVYALSLQGGSLGILYLTIFAALRLYQLIPQSFAFALLVLLTLGGGALAVLQNARGLATLGVVGGFLAPILVSTGTGNHVVLFSYYLVLNALILGVAWYRPWRELNLIGFVFTFVIGGVWAWRRYEHDLYSSIQPFVALFFLFYQAVAILFARRAAVAMRGIVDGTLVFGTPVLVFAMQAVMLRHTEFGLAYSAIVAALFYAVTATLLARSRSPRLRLLIEAYLALAVAFATLAVPLALDARWTAASWALEGAALVWIGRRQDRLLARAGGVLLVVGAGLAFLDHGWRALEGPPVLNGNLLGGLLIATSGLFCARLLERASGRWASLETGIARLLVAFGIAWWLGAGTAEIAERVPESIRMSALVAFYPASAVLLTLVAARLDWRSGRGASLVSLPLLVILSASFVLRDARPLADYGWVAWPFAIAAQFWMLRRHAATLPALTALAHPITALLATFVATIEVYQLIQQHLPGIVWCGTVASVVPGLAMLGVFRLRDLNAWPVSAFSRPYTLWAGVLMLALQWLLVLRLNLSTGGDATPLPYVPLVNPVDLASGYACVCAWYWSRESGEAPRDWRIWLAVVAFAISTLAVLRATHQLGDVPWRADAMVESVLVQAAISVYWGLLAFAAMVIGARRMQRHIWLAGAGLMGVVVIKLFLVELGNTGTVARIVSFIAIGALLLIVGYLAPVPPRRPEGTDATQ